MSKLKGSTRSLISNKGGGMGLTKTPGNASARKTMAAHYKNIRTKGTGLRARGGASLRQAVRNVDHRAQR